MKKLFLVAILNFTSLLLGCPTCSGRITHNSPAYFSDSFYIPYKMVAQQSTAPQSTQTTAQKSESVTPKGR